MSTQVQKICSVCGIDVSKLKRTKDERGNYFCAPCWQADPRAKVSAVPSRQPAPAARPVAPAITSGPVEPTDEDLPELPVAASASPAISQPHSKAQMLTSKPAIMAGGATVVTLSIGLSFIYFVFLCNHPDNKNRDRLPVADDAISNPTRNQPILTPGSNPVGPSKAENNQTLLSPQPAALSNGNTTTLSHIMNQPFAEVKVEAEWATLDPKAMVYGTEGNGWDVGDIPPELEGAQFTRFPMHHKLEEGKTAFTVEKPGAVLLGCTPNWGKGGGGGWKAECTSQAALEEQGWKSVARARNWIIFYRECKAGENFTIRTEKYNPPILIRIGTSTHGSADSIHVMGSQQDEGLAHEHEDANSLFSKAVELLEKGSGSDKSRALENLKKAIDLGSVPAMNYLGHAYLTGKGIPKDPTSAIPLFLKAANAGDVGAMTSLGVIYQDGLGVAPDAAEAVRWYQKSSDGDDPTGMVLLAAMLRDGTGVAKNEAYALQWLKRSADLKQPVAMYTLGTMYESGDGVAKNEAEAARLYRQAADLGNTGAMFSLGNLYFSGRGVQQNYTQALELYQKAGNAGEAEAAFDVGVIFTKGLAGSTDKATALKWFRLAQTMGFDRSNTAIAAVMTQLAQAVQDRATCQYNSVAHEKKKQELWRKANQYQDVGDIDHAQPLLRQALAEAKADETARQDEQKFSDQLKGFDNADVKAAQEALLADPKTPSKLQRYIQDPTAWLLDESPQ